MAVTITENAYKLVYIASKYPKHNLSQILALMQLPGIDINCAVWRAVDMGWLKTPDKDNPVEVLTMPDLVWGEEIHTLIERIKFAFKKLAVTEQDPGEIMLGEWCGGYPSHDVLIAMQVLIGSGVIDSYTITSDKDGTYTFYTLHENLGKDWGRSQFKNQKKLTVKHNHD
jgi:hypothetical protein